MRILGEVKIDGESGQLVCNTPTDEDRRTVLSRIRSLAPNTRGQLDGTQIRLDIKAGLALWEGRKKCLLNWSPEASSLLSNFASGYATRNQARRRLFQLQKEEITESRLEGYPLLNNLDPHQRIAVAAMTDSLIYGMCIFDEQGSGKTVMAIHAFDRLVRSGQSSSMLIFAPKNMLPEWKKDFEKFLGKKYKIEVIAGDKEKKLNALIEPADVYITNYETAHSMESSLRSLLLRKRNQRMVLTIDESFLVKNAKAARAAAVRRLRLLCERCWVLCGTPAPNNAIDVIHQFDIADCGVTFASVILPKEPKALYQTVKNVVEKRGLYLRRLKTDVLPGIPDKNFESVSVPMAPIQRKLYGQALKGLIRDVESAKESEFIKFYQSFLARRMALFGICSNPRQKFSDYTEIPGKYKALDELLEELITARKEKVVLWSYFRKSLDELSERYSKYKPVRLDGSVNSVQERGNAVEQFQNNPETGLFIANPAAAGAGITLTAARIAIYESFPVQTAHFLQSIDRIHRRGQDREVHYYFLLSEGTIEEDEYERLREKERHASELFGDIQPDITTKEFFLRDLEKAMLRLK